MTREREWGEEGELLKRQLLCTRLSSQGHPRHTGLLHGCESQASKLTTLVGCTSLLCHYGAHLSPVSRCHDTTQAALSFPAWTLQASISPIHNFSNKTSTMGNHSVWMRLCISVPIFTSIFTAHERVFTAGHWAGRSLGYSDTHSQPSGALGKSLSQSEPPRGGSEAGTSSLGSRWKRTAFVAASDLG